MENFRPVKIFTPNILKMDSVSHPKPIPKEKPKPIPLSMKGKKKINKVSKKEKLNIASKKKCYKKFDKMMGEQNKRFCLECRSLIGLSHSHLVPVSFNKKLESVISNIVYDCQFKPGEMSCHDKWETHDPEIMKSMKSYDERMERIKVLDPKYYALLTNKN